MRFVDRSGLERLLEDLVDRGYRLIGPTVRDGAIVLDEISSSDELPRGMGEEQEAGRYRVVFRADDRWFGFAHGPDSAKRFLFPAREVLGTAARDDGGLRIDHAALEDERPIAFVGIRSCDLHAVAVHDRVFLEGPAPDPAYDRRRRDAVFVAVNCEFPGGTCFCASMETGPRCTRGFDVALTELDGGFVAEAGTELGAELLLASGAREASPAEQRSDREVTERATGAMGRNLETGDLPELLYRNRLHPRWLEVGDRCLACGNCTSACPTCFCHDVVDTTDILGTTATRTREWASCFSDEFSHTVGGDVRTARSSRYRQWLTHKFASWIDQFGTSGCVGCGRCITWCPVGIDVTEEIAAIRTEDGVVVAAGVSE
jgi:sulfhydrogenase subunit beta (sulfur reductase)